MLVPLFVGSPCFIGWASFLRLVLFYALLIIYVTCECNRMDMLHGKLLSITQSDQRSWDSSQGMTDT